MELFEALETRRSIRKFKTTKLDKGVVEQLIRAGTFAPTSCNLQVYGLIYVDDPETLRELSRHVTGKVNWTSQLFVAYVDPDITSGNKANYLSLGMVLQNVMLAAVGLGLGTCPIAGFKGKSYLKNKFGIPEKYDVPLLVFVGYPDEEYKSSNPFRVEVDDVLSFGHYDLDGAFPSSIDIRLWTETQVNSYRERIFSVYFPRFRQGVFNKGYDNVWSRVSSSVKGRSSLLMFPWENQALEIAESEVACSVADSNNFYLAHLKKSLGGDRCVSIDDTQLYSFERICICGTLMFVKNRVAIFDFVSQKLSRDGVFELYNFSRFGLLGLVFGLLRIFRIRSHVYNESSFYKIGPYGFVKESEIRKKCADAGLQVFQTELVPTRVLESKAPKIFRPMFFILSKLFPETKLFLIKRLA